MMAWLGVRLASAVRRCHRLLKNPRHDQTELVATRADALCRTRERHLPVLLDRYPRTPAPRQVAGVAVGEKWRAVRTGPA
jgi:hypothetical protein